jgi:hypothetical protein
MIESLEKIWRAAHRGEPIPEDLLISLAKGKDELAPSIV